MDVEAGLFAALGVDVIRGIVAEFQHVEGDFLFDYVRRYRSAVCDFVEAGFYVMAGRPRCCSHAFLIQADHVLAVGLEDVAIVRFRPGGLREPPDVFNGVPDADALDRHPFGGHGHFRGIEPEAFLGEMKAKLFDQGDEQLEMVNGAGRGPFVIASAEVQDKTAVVR